MVHSGNEFALCIATSEVTLNRELWVACVGARLRSFADGCGSVCHGPTRGRGSVDDKFASLQVGNTFTYMISPGATVESESYLD
jgi:hypothetical protein